MFLASIANWISDTAFEMLSDACAAALTTLQGVGRLQLPQIIWAQAKAAGEAMSSMSEAASGGLGAARRAVSQTPWHEEAPTDTTMHSEAPADPADSAVTPRRRHKQRSKTTRHHRRDDAGWSAKRWSGNTSDNRQGRHRAAADRSGSARRKAMAARRRSPRLSARHQSELRDVDMSA